MEEMHRHEARRRSTWSECEEAHCQQATAGAQQLLPSNSKQGQTKGTDFDSYLKQQIRKTYVLKTGDYILQT